jgi:hypothetical protein
MICPPLLGDIAVQRRQVLQRMQIVLIDQSVDYSAEGGVFLVEQDPLVTKTTNIAFKLVIIPCTPGLKTGQPSNHYLPPHFNSILRAWVKLRCDGLLAKHQPHQRFFINREPHKQTVPALKVRETIRFFLGPLVSCSLQTLRTIQVRSARSDLHEHDIYL